jgi:hypothetical protein
MRRFFVALAIGFVGLTAHGQKTRLGQGLEQAKPGVVYPIKVHVSGIHFRTDFDVNYGLRSVGAGGPRNGMYVDAVMNGQKVEFQLAQEPSFPLYDFPLGDEQARLLKDPHKSKNTLLFQEYELLLPDNTVWRGIVTGISE